MDGMDDLIAFLRARLDEDAATARAAAEVCGCHGPAARWVFGDDENDGRIVIVDDPHPETKRKVERRWNGSYDGLFAARHIARHDPARVLAEVDAKRQRLEILADAIERGHDDYDIATELFPLEALPYASHPDYRDTWRP